MREFVFELQYEPGVHPVMDIFIDHPDLRSEAVNICASQKRGWRIDQIDGPSGALAELDDIFLDPTVCNDGATPSQDCDARVEYDVLAETETSRTVYAYVIDVTYCHSISYFATKHAGDGLLFRASRRQDTYEWHVLLPDERSARAVYDSLQEVLVDGVGVTFQRLSNPDEWGAETLSHLDLSVEQRRALRTAVSSGYYETPSRTTLRELAEQLDVPPTTLQYRLQRAESCVLSNAVEFNS